ncbi:hypothetical protein EMIT0P294_30564 [Pseudomonas sp. IT-P294]
MIRITDKCAAWLLKLGAMKMITPYVHSADELTLDLFRVCREHGLSLHDSHCPSTNEALYCVVHVTCHC